MTKRPIEDVSQGNFRYRWF